MLGDSEHGQYLYLKTIIEFLNYWIDRHIANPMANIPHKICLVLEMDSAYNADLHKFFKSGDYSDFLCLRLYNGKSASIRNLQFYYDLKEILNRIQDYNIKTPRSKLYLDVLGPERNWDMKNWSELEGAEYFIYQRDIDICNNILEYIKSHPDYKMMAYYGSGHLISTNYMKRTPLRSGESYYLGHYLKEKSKSIGGFYRICQACPKDAGPEMWMAFCPRIHPI